MVAGVKTCRGGLPSHAQHVLSGATCVPACAQVLSEVKGRTLVGTTYQPLFPYFAHLKAAAALPNGSAANGLHSGSSGAFRVISDAYVKDDSGTGVVHQAPAFGEDDFRICIEHGEDQNLCVCFCLLCGAACLDSTCCARMWGALPVCLCSMGKPAISTHCAGIVGKGEDMPCPVDGEGRFTPEVTDFSGRSASRHALGVAHTLLLSAVL